MRVWGLLTAAVLLAPPVPAFAQEGTPSFDANDPRTAFRDMAEYLVRDGGRWRGANPTHDPARPRSPSHFGLWFEESVNGHLLELTIVAYLGDSVLVSSKGHWAWNPVAEQLTHISIARNGLYAEGTTEFVGPKTFATIMAQHSPRGRTAGHRDDNIIVDANTHRNVSFSQSPDGTWTETGQWVWKRDPPGDPLP